MSRVKNLEEMRDFAFQFLSKIEDKNLVALTGNLGSGKTTFTKFLAEALGIKKNITSPTFNIVKLYSIEKNKKHQFDKLYHIDCYRLTDKQEIIDLGYFEWLTDKKALIVVEWADKVTEILPKGRIELEFKVVNETEREVSLRLRSGTAVKKTEL
jgi:tRNA threonylcarbamoyladenosine biosynthesis protein TsaE